MEKRPVGRPSKLSDPDGTLTPPVLAELTERQRAFAEYMALYNQPLKAGRMAGYGDVADNNSGVHVLARKPEIVAAIQYYKELFADASQTSPLKIIREMSLLAYADISEYFTEDWVLKPKSQLTPVQRRALVGLEVIPTKYGLRAKPKLAKLEALLGLARMFGLDDFERDDAAQVSQGTSVTIHVGQREAPARDVTPTTVQIGDLVIVSDGRVEE